MLTTPTIHHAVHWFTSVRAFLLAVIVAAVAIGWHTSGADATEDNAATFTVCSDKQGRLRTADDAEDCTSNEEFLELDLVTGQALENATADLEARISELESDLQGQIDDLVQTIDNQAGEIDDLESRVAELEDNQGGGSGDSQLEGRVTDLEDLLDGVNRDEIDGHDTLRFAGMNLQLVNDEGFTASTNGLGNLIIGYNDAGFRGPDRGGSHNLVIGDLHSFASSGGLVAGRENTISGTSASVTGGSGNTASGFGSSVSGGENNTASHPQASVSGGTGNTASDSVASVSGGFNNTASGPSSSVSGGAGNTASAPSASVSGGSGNGASNNLASVSGGFNNTASGFFASVTGGEANEASGDRSSILGGQKITVNTDFGIYPGP